MYDNVLCGKKVIVTGGCGFVGSHLIKRLLAEGSKVYIIDRKNINTWRIKDELQRCEISSVDITYYTEVDKYIKNVKPEYVFHLAAYGVDSANKEYITAAKTNIMGIINILNSLKDVGCKKFINIGSCAEYGDREVVLREDMNLKPVSIYGSTKACATILAHQIASENNIDIVTLRPFGIFGEGEERHKIFCHIILSILEGKDVNLTQCNQERDYCHVDNIVDGMILSAQKDQVKNNIFNIASGVVHPLRYYVELIFNNIETETKPIFGAVEYRKNEMWTPRADINSIQSILQWKPKITLEEGIVRTINWYKKNKDLYYFK